MEAQEMVDKNTRVGKEEEVGNAEKKRERRKKVKSHLRRERKGTGRDKGAGLRRRSRASVAQQRTAITPRPRPRQALRRGAFRLTAREIPPVLLRRWRRDTTRRKGPCQLPDAADAWSRPASRQRRAVSGKRHQAATTSSRGEVGLKCEQNLPRLTKPAPAAGWSPLALTMATPRVSPSPLSPAHCRLRHGHPPPHTCIPGQQ